MKAHKGRVSRGLNHGSTVNTCDNSGAKIVRVISVKNLKTRKGRKPRAGVGDLVLCSVKKGTPEMRKQVVFGVIVRQKMPYRRAAGEHIRFEDNAIVVLKDDKGNPKGTIFKGAIAKEATERWPGIAKVASIIV